MPQFHHSAITGLALSALAALAGADQEEQPDLFSSEAAAVRFAVPAGSQVYEREIYLDRAGEAPGSMVLIRIVPRGLTEESSLLATQVVVEVSRLSPGTSLKEWASRGCAPSVGSEAWTERPLAVEGQPGLRRERQEADGTRLTQVFVIKGGRGYRFSARGPENEAVLWAILESVHFEAEGGSSSVPAAADPVTSLVAPEVRMIYLVPSDRVVSDSYRLGMNKAIRQLQVFYRTQIANGKTFTIHNPVVEVIQTSHPVVWYTTEAPSPSPESRFWNSVLVDGFALTGGTFSDASNRWIFYIDADHLCNQFVGATNGVAVLPANDFRGLTCAMNVPPCGGPGDNAGVCRWVGGLGHELGHAFNLPHPPGCETTGCVCPAPDTACNNALMWVGYAVYPNAYLLPSDINSLITSPTTAQFFTTLDPGPLSTTCSGGCSRDDIAWYQSASNAITVLLSNGSSFSNNGPPWITMSGPPTWAGAGDFTGDGKDDIAWYDSSTNIAVLLSNGSAFTNDGPPWAQGYGAPTFASVGDFNGDGKDDIAWYEEWNNNGITVLLSAGTMFQWAGQWRTGLTTPTWAGAGDFNGDGRDDIVGFYTTDGTAKVLLSNGSGFSVGSTWATGLSTATAVRAGDFNGDGKDDIAWYAVLTGEITVLLSNGSAFTSAGPPWATGLGLPTLAAIGDVNGDGQADVWSYQSATSAITVLLSNGSAFTNNGQWITGLTTPNWAGVGNFNGQ